MDNNNFGGGRPQFDRQMHPATCSDCNKETEVPFKPSGDRPVYCRECYNKKRDDRGFGGGGRNFRR